MKTAASRSDAFFDLTIGGYSAAMGGSGIEKIQGQFSRRDENVVQYWSPKVSGIELRLAHAVNEARTASANPTRSGGSISYTDGALQAGIAYDQLVDTPFVGVTPIDKQSGRSVSGTLVAGPLRLGALYQQFRRDGFSTQNAGLGSVIGTLGQHRFIYQYQRARGGTNLGVERSRSSPAPEPRALLFPPPGIPGCDVNEVGYRYIFSRQTFFVAQYVVVDNNDSATCNFGSNTLLIDFGQDPRGFALGVRHTF